MHHTATPAEVRLSLETHQSFMYRAEALRLGKVNSSFMEKRKEPSPIITIGRKIEKETRPSLEK